MKPGKPTYVTSEKARKTHSRSKLHKFMQDKYDPVGGMRDSQKIKNLIEWQRHWIESQRIPTDAIEGRTSLEELGERWDKMDSGERKRLLRQVNQEEYLLGNSSFGEMGSDDKYYKNQTVARTWNKFSDEDKKKILRAYTWSFSYVYYDVERQQDVTYTTFDAKYEMYEKLVEEEPGELRPVYKACQGCGLYLGKNEEELSEELSNMCRKCFREQTDQTHEWYDTPPATKILKEGVRIRMYRDSKGKWHKLYGNFVDDNLDGVINND